MQQIVRTIDTAEAFKLKIKLLKDELVEKKEEASKLEATGVFTSAGGGFLKLLGVLAYIIFIAAMLVFIPASLSSEDDPTFRKSASGVVAFLFFSIGFLSRKKGKKMQKDANEKHEIAEQKRQLLLAEIESLEAEIKRQEAIIQNHMLNQHELLDLEIKAIHQLSQNRAQVTEDSKECPMCAETIRAKARICRYCNYAFADAEQ